MLAEVWHLSGASSGPTVLITAGIHGDEYEGPAAVAQVMQELEAKPLRGTVIAIPVSNPMAWNAGTRLSPDDLLNLARIFPGNLEGLPTERLAAEIFAFASEADYLIDLHSGGSDYLFLPLAGFYDEKSLEAARHFGLPVLWRLPETDGVLSCEFHRRGKTAIGCEYLGAGQLSRDGVEAYRRGILSCLALWGLLPGETPLAPGGEPFTGDWMLAEAIGQFFAETELGDLVEPGRLLATIRDIRGDVLQSFVAPHAGIVLAIRSKAYIRSGDWGILVATHA